MMGAAPPRCAGPPRGPGPLDPPGPRAARACGGCGPRARGAAGRVPAHKGPPVPPGLRPDPSGVRACGAVGPAFCALRVPACAGAPAPARVRSGAARPRAVAPPSPRPPGSPSRARAGLRPSRPARCRRSPAAPSAPLRPPCSVGLAPAPGRRWASRRPAGPPRGLAPSGGFGGFARPPASPPRSGPGGAGGPLARLFCAPPPGPWLRARACAGLLGASVGPLCLPWGSPLRPPAPPPPLGAPGSPRPVGWLRPPLRGSAFCRPACGPPCPKIRPRCGFPARLTVLKLSTVQ